MDRAPSWMASIPRWEPNPGILGWRGPIPRWVAIPAWARPIPRWHGLSRPHKRLCGCQRGALRDAAGPIALTTGPARPPGLLGAAGDPAAAVTGVWEAPKGETATKVGNLSLRSAEASWSAASEARCRPRRGARARRFHVRDVWASDGTFGAASTNSLRGSASATRSVTIISA